MWYPNVSNEIWLRLHPQLKDELPIHCICGKQISQFIPFVSEDWSGFKGGLCGCGATFTSIAIPRTEKLNKAFYQFLNFSEL